MNGLMIVFLYIIFFFEKNYFLKLEIKKNKFIS